MVKHDDEVIAKVVVGEKPITAPENQAVTVGGSTLKVNRSGESYKSKKTMYMQATAYSGGGKTATGRSVVHNPSAIKYNCSRSKSNTFRKFSRGGRIWTSNCIRHRWSY